MRPAAVPEVVSTGRQEGWTGLGDGRTLEVRLVRVGPISRGGTGEVP